MSAIRAHMFRLLRAGIEKHTDVRARLASGSGNLAFYRSIIEALQPLLEKDMEEEPIESFPLPSHPETGLKRIPVWAAQPYVRPLPVGTYKAIKDANSRSADGTTTPGVLEDMITGGTGEERVIGQGKSDVAVDHIDIAQPAYIRSSNSHRRYHGGTRSAPDARSAKVRERC